MTALALAAADRPQHYALGAGDVEVAWAALDVAPGLLEMLRAANDDPFGADRQTQDPYFELEGHITRNLNSRFWIAGDAMYQYGSGTSTDGADDDNTRMNLNIGATVGPSLNASMQLRVSYAYSIAHNDFGMQGQGARIMLIGAF